MKQIAAISLISIAVIVSFIMLTRKPSPSTPVKTDTYGYNTSPTPMTTNIPTPTLTSTTPITGKPKIEFTTSKGKFVIELRPDVAPKTVENYFSKWTSGFCDGLTFHRVEDWVVQGCDPLGNGTGGGSTLPTETSKESFTLGSVGVARKASPKEVSNDSQFFIVKNDSTFLDGEYTWFGKVVSGMDVVTKTAVGDKILSTKLVK